jgi:hypothetical protein
MTKQDVSTNQLTCAQPFGEWQPIKTAPVGPAILLANDKTGVVCAGYGEWMDGVPRPRFVGVDDSGFGRFNATHWMPFPQFKIE